MNSTVQHFPSHIVLGIDGSEACLAGITMLKDLPCFTTSRIRAVSVIGSKSPAERARMDKALQLAESLLGSGCATITTELMEGHPAETLVRLANEQNADLIVLGATGLRATLGILLGGVAQQVVEHAGCAVLVTRAPYRGLKNILLAVDGSECSEAALKYLARFSLLQDSQVHVFSVSSAIGLSDLNMGAWPVGHELVPVLSDRDLDELEKIRNNEREHAQELVQNAVEQLKAAGARADGALAEGDAATEIIRYCKNHEVDLLVAGSRGLSRISGWLMGSVSRKLVNFAPCSVLIVKSFCSPDDA